MIRALQKSIHLSAVIVVACIVSPPGAAYKGRHMPQRDEERHFWIDASGGFHLSLTKLTAISLNGHRSKKVVDHS